MKDLKIPAGIQPGETVKIRRMGVPDINKPSVRGDHHFIVNVLIPKEIRYVPRNYKITLLCSFFSDNISLLVHQNGYRLVMFCV